MTIGLLALGRPTFDVDFANRALGGMLARLDATGRRIVGARELLVETDATRAAIESLQNAGIDRLLIVQATFTDAAMTVAAADALDVPLSIWAVPEPRLGGRLRLNAFCGLNLASHALGLRGRSFTWAYEDPAQITEETLAALLDGRSGADRLEGRRTDTDPDAGERILAAIRGSRVARIGDHPVGFDTCAYSERALADLAGVAVDAIGLDRLFSTAQDIADDEVSTLRRRAEGAMDGLGDVDQVELDRSLRLKGALERIRTDGGYRAFAIRCWPETFTEYGGAVCGPVSMMGEVRVPCACEADVYGALTQMILQEAAQAPVFLTDLVDVDRSDDTAVVWHCGQAPVSMCAAGVRPQATIHTNRRMPLLYQFALRPGRITLARMSQAFGQPRLVLAGAEMLDRPMAFTGTSGTLRFDSGSNRALDAILASGLEHHMALAYGDHREVLRSVAAAMDVPVLEL